MPSPPKYSSDLGHALLPELLLLLQEEYLDDLLDPDFHRYLHSFSQLVRAFLQDFLQELSNLLVLQELDFFEEDLDEDLDLEVDFLDEDLELDFLEEDLEPDFLDEDLEPDFFEEYLHLDLEVDVQ